MIDGWYFAEQEQAVGPFRLADLRVKLQKISNWTDVLVWRHGFGDWQRAGDSREIVACFATPPPIPRNIALDFHSEPLPASKKSRSRWFARILGSICLLALGIVVGAFWDAKAVYEFGKGAYSSVMKPPPAKNAGDVEEETAKALIRLRAELPKKIDDTTTLMWVRSQGTRLIFEYRVAVDGAKFDDAIKDKLRLSVTKHLCNGADTRRILALGGSFQYVYSDVAGAHLMTVDVVKDNCSW
jgi:hypothetical protein